MDVTYRIDENGLAANLASAPHVTGQKLLANMRTLGEEFERYIKGELLSGQILEPRTGMGRRSIFYRLEVNSSTQDVELLVGADLGKAKYMRAQALGATITPKKGRYLAIPLEAARTAKGVARFSARELFDHPESFGYVDAFVHKSIIFGVKSRKRSKSGVGEVVPLFVLKSRVVLPSRNYLVAARQGLERRVRELVDDVANATVQAVVKGGTPSGDAGSLD
jgi:hypothetical protein